MRRCAVLLAVLLLLAGCGAYNVQEDMASVTETPPAAGSTETPEASADEIIRCDLQPPQYRVAKASDCDADGAADGGAVRYRKQQPHGAVRLSPVIYVLRLAVPGGDPAHCVDCGGDRRPE